MRNPQRSNRQHKTRLEMEVLEDRQVPAVITVDSLADNLDPSDNLTTLREALQTANATAGSDEIQFDHGLFDGGPQALPMDTTLGQFEITDGVLIKGPGADLLSIDAQQQSRVFLVDDNDVLTTLDVTLDGMTIRGGRVSGYGGGILNAERLTLVNATVSGNSASLGGGLLNHRGTMTLHNSTVSDNEAHQGGGLFNLHGTMDLHNSTVSTNSADAGAGLMNVHSTMTLHNSTVSDNRATQLTGGLYNSTGIVTLRNSIVANSSGGDVYGTAFTEGANIVEDGSVTGPNVVNVDPLLAPLGDYGGPTRTHAFSGPSAAIDAGDNNFVGGLTADQRGYSFARVVNGQVDIGAYEHQLHVDTLVDENDGDYSMGDRSLREMIDLANATDTFDLITFAEGLKGSIALTQGPLIISADVTIFAPETTAIRIDGQHQSRVFLIDDGDTSTTREITLENLTITGGLAEGLASADDGLGGGILNRENLTLNGSTLAGNSAATDGGGLFNDNGRVTTRNSTISGNSAGKSGGGLFNDAGTVTLRSTTVSDNSAPVAGGLHTDASTVTLQNSIIANSTGADVVGTVVSKGVNVVEDGSVKGVNVLNVDPLLGPLGDYGGSTLTHALLAHSPAINAGDNTLVDDLSTDQRGESFARMVGGQVDIGAFEAGANDWSQRPGRASDIGGGADGSVWMLGTENEPGGHRIYRWNGPDWQEVGGRAVRIDVDPSGNAWVVNKNNDIFRFDGQGWQHLPGSATDIGVGADGTVWIVGADQPQSDSSVYRWDGSDWQQVAGRAMRIDVDPSGNAWVVNSAHQIYRFDGHAWQPFSGGATDISLGADGALWIIGGNEHVGGYDVYRWNGTGWDQASEQGTQISVGPDGMPWIVDEEGLIHQKILRQTPTVLTVTSLADVVDPYDNLTTLREALVTANEHVGTADEIRFDPSLFDGPPQTLVMAGVDFVIKDSVTIRGPGADLLSIHLSPGSRGFTVNDHRATTIDVTIEGTTITGGVSVPGRSNPAIHNAENLTLRGVVLSGNSLNLGGVLHNEGGTVTLRNSTVSGNTGGFYQGVLFNDGGTMTLHNSIVSGNTGWHKSAGVYNKSGTVELYNSTISDNSASHYGSPTYAAGLLNEEGGTVMLHQSTIASNSAGIGGGIANFGTMTLRDSTVSDNSGLVGGGLLNVGTLTLHNTTVSGNEGTGITSGGSLTLKNSTVSGNSGHMGGGVVVNAGQATLENTTVTHNSSPDRAGGVLNSGASVTLRNTIIANNGNRDFDNTDAGTVLLEGVNIVEDGSVTGPNVLNVDSLLGPLGYHGGPTQTHTLLAYSPAIDAGDNDFVDGLATDQRGEPFVRIAGGQVDIGAYERTHSDWSQVPGRATDIGIGADGTVWITQTNDPHLSSGAAQWNGTEWQHWSPEAVRVEVDPNGNTWVINSAHQIFHFDGQEWQQLPGKATDIGIGANGSVWIVGADEMHSRNGVYSWNGTSWWHLPGQTVLIGNDPDYPWDIGTWVDLPGEVARVDVDPNGNPLVVNVDNQIYRYDGHNWHQLPGGANDIAVGADGSVWILGSDEGQSGSSIHRWNGSDWQLMPGEAVRIAVDRDGNAWVVNKNNAIFRFDGQRWQHLPGSATDIGISENGTVWIAGTDERQFGSSILRWEGTQWQTLPGEAVRIDVGPDGKAWMLDDTNRIFRWDGQSWHQLPGLATDIGVGADSTVWVIANGDGQSDSGIYRWSGNDWEQIPGAAMRVDVGPDGNTWVVTSAHQISRYDGHGWQLMPGSARDVGIGADGAVWIIGTEEGELGYSVYRWNGTGWDQAGIEGIQISVDPNGRPYVVDNQGFIHRATLRGTNDYDTFVLPKENLVPIADFHSAGNDVLDLRSLGADASIVESVVQDGNDTLIHLSNGQLIRLLSFLVSDFDEDDFLF